MFPHQKNSYLIWNKFTFWFVDLCDYDYASKKIIAITKSYVKFYYFYEKFFIEFGMIIIWRFWYFPSHNCVFILLIVFELFIVCSG